jgi:hypothetical protein
MDKKKLSDYLFVRPSSGDGFMIAEIKGWLTEADEYKTGLYICTRSHSELLELKIVYEYPIEDWECFQELTDSISSFF